MSSLPEDLDREMRANILAGFDRIYCSLLEAQWKTEEALQEAADHREDPQAVTE